VVVVPLICRTPKEFLREEISLLNCGKFNSSLPGKAIRNNKFTDGMETNLRTASGSRVFHQLLSGPAAAAAGPWLWGARAWTGAGCPAISAVAHTALRTGALSQTAVNEGI